MNKFSLENKIALVTGGGGLLALQHASAILKTNGNLILIDVSKSKLSKNLEILKKKFNKKIHYFVCDITKEKKVLNLMKKLRKINLIPDILINNAAINYNPGNIKVKKFRLETFDIQNLTREINVGLIGATICTKIFGYEMAKKKYGIILNIGSDLSFISPDQTIYKKKNLKPNFQEVKPISYSIVKHGIVGLTKYTATYWANQNVRCNLLAPGGIYNGQPKEFLKKIKKIIPLNRMATHGEYEETIIYLISDASSYMNGASLIIDGGRTVL